LINIQVFYLKINLFCLAADSYFIVFRSNTFQAQGVANAGVDFGPYLFILPIVVFSRLVDENQRIIGW
jgi:hypothetical protein